MRKVEVLSSSVVKPAKETPKHSIWLSNIDLVRNYRNFTPIIYVYKNTGGDEGFFAVDAIKASLAKTLDVFYPYAGRLGVDDDGRLEIECNGEGALFVEASCELTIEEFGDFSPSKEIYDLLVPFAASADPPCPMMLCQLTRFKCGGVVIATKIHHRVGDGSNSLRLFNSWSDITRGVDPSTIPPPVVDRTSLRARSPPSVEFEHDEYRMPAIDAHQTPPPPPPSSTVTLRLSKEQVAKLKEKACGKTTAATTFAAIVSHTWRCITKARKLSPDQTTRLRILANAKAAVDPPLSPFFQGNVVVHITTTVTSGDLLSSELDQVAEKIEEAKLGLTDRYVRSVIDFLEVRDGTRDWPPLQPTEFIAVNWLRLPIYDADFGWGKPAYTGRALIPRPGGMYAGRVPGFDGVQVTANFEDDIVPLFVKYFYDDLDGNQHEKAAKENDIEHMKVAKENDIEHMKVAKENGIGHVKLAKEEITA